MLNNVDFKECLLFWNGFSALENCKNVKWMNQRATPKEAYTPTKCEHIANVITHGFWVIPSILGTIELCKRSSTSPQFLSALVYGATLIFLFTVSTSFHCVFFCQRHRHLKNVLHRCDRAMIYIFIAGSYFPWLTLQSLPTDGYASSMRWFVWFLAFLGIIYQQAFHEKYKKLEIIFYLIMGIGPSIPIVTEHSLSGIYELTTGGLLYILGVLFFKCDGVIPFAHAIWHMFVVLAAGTHYYAILNYLYPHTQNNLQYS